MEYENSTRPDKNWKDTSSTIAPIVLGAATGILVGDLMCRRARRPVAVALLSLGAAAISPMIKNFIVERLSDPKTKRGSEKRLESIRDGAYLDWEDTYSEEI